MSWYLEALSFPIHINAQSNPTGAIFLFALVAVVLWLFIAQARRRDERRSARRRDLSTWRSRQPPRP